MSDTPDLSVPRLVQEHEVARLFHLSIRALRYRVSAGTFPVEPKIRRPAQWSSVELLRFLEDARRRS